MASLVASIALALGLAIFSLAQKQVELSSLGRDSQLAFYAADTGAECGLYWDMRRGSFSTTTPPATVACDGQDAVITHTDTGSGGSWTSTTFNFQFESRGTNPSGYCVNIAITKHTVTGSPGTVGTTITSDGFSVACNSVNSSQAALERTVELTY
jgi:hypothetical protein